MDRPKHLPDFKKPPLNEVVIGTQFSEPKGYQQIRAGEVWGLFKEKFPKVKDLPPIPPTFETFGLPQPTRVNFEIMAGTVHNRFWFLSASEDELIQFQNDRIHHNWRKVGDQSNEYPRFEKMIESFSCELKSLEKYASSLIPQSIHITQCEVSYINHIYLEENDNLSSAQNWIKFLNFGDITAEDFSIVFRNIIKDENNKPIGRLICDASSAIGAKGKKMVVLSLTARGLPLKPEIDSAIEFLRYGREKVINFFVDNTTDEAHKHWERNCRSPVYMS